MKKIKDYLSLYLTFFKIGLFTFGGGYPMIALMTSEVVDKKKWLTTTEMLDIVAISESTPGPVSINTATFVGNKQKGLLGGILATLGVITPSIIIISLIAGFYDKFIQIELINKALKGIVCAVVILISFSAIKLSKGLKDSGNKFINLIFVFITLLLKVFTNISSIYIVIIAGLLGWVIYYLFDRRRKAK